MTSRRKLDNCPREIQECGQVLYHNGFGIQSPGCGTENTYVVCWCKFLEQDQLNIIKTESSSTTLVCDDFIGRNYLQIHWSEYNLIELILTSMLLHGHSFRMAVKCAEVYFQAPTDVVFTWEEFELKMIHQISILMTSPYHKIENDHDDRIYSWTLFNLWNWKTAQGKMFCRKLRILKQLPEQNEETDKENYFKWKMFAKPSLSSVRNDELPHIESGARDRNFPLSSTLIEEPDTCMICLDATANTLVLPCEHQVVCLTCSNSLTSTNDAHTCVRCRQPISTIHSDIM